MSGFDASELDPYVADTIRGTSTKQKELETLEIVEARPGHIVFEADAPESVMNYHGTIQGGYLATVSELAAGMALYASGLSSFAVASSMNFIKAVGTGRLVVKADPVHQGRTTAVIRCAVETLEGALIAESTYTMLVMGPLEGLRS